MEYRKHDGHPSLAEFLKAKEQIDLGDDRIALLAQRKGDGYVAGKPGKYVPDETSPLVWRVYNEDAWNCEADIDRYGLDLPSGVSLDIIRIAWAWYQEGYGVGKKDGHWSGAFDKEREFSDAIGLLRRFGIGTVVMNTPAEE